MVMDYLMASLVCSRDEEEPGKAKQIYECRV
jgi:hypothetical protein